MRVLLDECLPGRLTTDFVGHKVRTLRDMGWLGKSNGDLLALGTAEGFEVFVTADQKLPYQQNLQKTNLILVILIARDNRLASLRQLMPRLLACLPSLHPGDCVRID